MKTVLVVGLVVMFGLSACGRKPAPSSSAPAPKTGPGISIESQNETAPPPLAPADPTLDKAANPPPDQDASLKELTTAIQTYMQVSPDYPKDLKDLVTMKLIKRVPTPPPGKKFAIDRQNICVILVDK